MSQVRVVIGAVVTAVATLGAAALVLAPPGGGLATAQAAGAVKTSLTLSAPASGPYGSIITMTGKLSRTGTTTGLRGATVWLQRSVHGKNAYTNLRSARTTASGIYTTAANQTSAYDYRVYYAGSATYARAYSPVRYPVTTYKVVLNAITTTNADQGRLSATGQVTPAPPNGSTVYLQRYNAATKLWVNLATAATSAGKVTVAATRPAGTESYRLVIPTRYPYGTGISATKQFTHYVWRNAFSSQPRNIVTAGTTGSSRTGDGIRLELGKSSRMVIFPEVTGCLQARSMAANALTTNGNTVVQLISAETQNRSGQLEPGGPVLALEVPLAASNPSLEFDASTFTLAGSATYLTLQLRCAN